LDEHEIDSALRGLVENAWMEHAATDIDLEELWCEVTGPGDEEVAGSVSEG
jgi:hypothetical protein